MIRLKNTFLHIEDPSSTQPVTRVATQNGRKGKQDSAPEGAIHHGVFWPLSNTEGDVWALNHGYPCACKYSGLCVEMFPCT